MIAVPITVPDVAHVETALAHGARARQAGADLIEWRVDALADSPQAVCALVEAAPLPCILTCRAETEGGGFDGSPETRVTMLEHLAAKDTVPRYVDVEYALWHGDVDLQRACAALQEIGTGLILSSHDFEGRPDDLHRRVAAMSEAPCDVVKVAWRARSIRDALECCDLLAARTKPMIALCMGEHGLMSRVFAGAWGGLLTFAALDDDSGSAPGQPTIGCLADQWRFRSLTANSSLYGLIGDPLGDSPGLVAHNERFARCGLDGVYLPLPVAGGFESLKATLEVLLHHSAVHFSGASVTLPHKIDLVRWGKARGARIDPVAASAGAANTITVEQDTVTVANTDAAGIVDPLRLSGLPLEGASALVLGAGGAARAACVGLSQAGAVVRVHNRTDSRARQLIDETTTVGAGQIAMHAVDEGPYDIIIHATPAGMAHGPLAGQDVFDVLGLDPGKVLCAQSVFFETVYAPPVTPSMTIASANGCTVIDGRTMWAAQAARQQALWGCTSGV